MPAAARCKFDLDGPTWNSTVSFDSGISVALAGALDVQLAAGVDPTSLLGQNFQLFNWTGVTPQGQFGQIASSPLPPNYYWDTSKLYTLGTLDLALSSANVPVTGQWAVNGGGLWSAEQNWTGSLVPQSPQDTALFGAALTGGTAAVTLDIPVNLASLNFSATNGASYVIEPSVSGSLTLSNTAGPATIGNSGSNTIAAPILLRSNLSVGSSANSVLTIAGDISESGSSCSLTLGGGELVLSGSNTYSGGTTVSGGTLIATNCDALADGSDLTVGNPAAFAPLVSAGSTAERKRRGRDNAHSRTGLAGAACRRRLYAGRFPPAIPRYNESALLVLSTQYRVMK